MSNIATLVNANQIANLTKWMLDNCKQEVNSSLDDMESIDKPIELNKEDFNPNIDYKENAIYALYDNGERIGNFFHKKGYFFPISSRSIDTPQDKEAYEQQKRSWNINNCDIISFSESSLKTLRKNLDDSILSQKAQTLIEAKESGQDFIRSSQSYRMNAKEAEAYLYERENFYMIIEQSAKKQAAKAYGLSLLRMFGYSEVEEPKTKLSESQKDTLMHYLIGSEGLRSKDEVGSMLEELSFYDKINLIEPLSVLYTDCDNYVKANQDLKARTSCYTCSFSYEIDTKTLKKELRLTEEDLKAFLKKFDGKGIKAETQKKFDYSGDLDSKRVYFIKNSVFDKEENSFKSEKFNIFKEKNDEAKEVLNSIKDRQPVSNRSFGKSSRPKIK